MIRYKIEVLCNICVNRYFRTANTKNEIVSKADFMRQLLKEGWSFEGKKHICPQCTKFRKNNIDKTS